jgi:hypothetical protein
MNTNATISFNTNSRFLARIELVMFNCPKWGIDVQAILTTSATASVLSSSNPAIYSCDYLVKVCLSLNTSQAVCLQLFPFPGFEWVHLAEVMFIGESSTCPPAQVLSLPDTTAPPDITAMSTSTDNGTYLADV